MEMTVIGVWTQARTIAGIFKLAGKALGISHIAVGHLIEYAMAWIIAQTK